MQQAPQHLPVQEGIPYCRGRQEKSSILHRFRYFNAIILSCLTSLHFTEDPTVRNKDSLFVDPVSIGILVVLALMFLVICMVLQLFSRSEIIMVEFEYTIFSVVPWLLTPLPCLSPLIFVLRAFLFRPKRNWLRI